MDARARWIIAAGIAVVAVSGLTAGAVALGGDDDASAPADTTTTTTTSSTTTTTTTVPETTTTTAAPAPPPPPGIGKGARGEAVRALESKLAAMKLDPGPQDGVFDQTTEYAVFAFQKLNGMRPSGRVTDAEQRALDAPAPITPLVSNGEPTRVEVDIARQLLQLYHGGELRLVSHVSTGSGKQYCVEGDCETAVTPRGGHRFAWRYKGWRTSRLGQLYNPVYFTSGGHAVHGATSVPTYPASHGCVRIPMHIAEYFPSLVKQGDAVYVVERPGAYAAPGGAPAGPPPPDPPSGETTTTTTAPQETTTTTTTTTPLGALLTTTTTAPQPTTTTTAAPLLPLP